MMRWLIRLLLAVILFFGSEILLWSDPFSRPLLEWAIAVPAYLILAALILEIMVRSNVRDLFGLMSVAGFYGLLNGLLINPQITLYDVPSTLVTRAMGGHSLLGLEMLVFFLALTGGYIRSLRWILLAGAAVVGLAWGTWVRWSPLLEEIPYDTLSLETMLFTGLVFVLIIFALLQLAYRRAANIPPEGLLLNSTEWAIITPALSAIIFIRLLQDLVSTPALVITILVFAVNGGILWFRKETVLPMTLRYHLPIRPLRVMWFALAVVILFWTGLLAYNLPPIEVAGINQVIVVVAGFNLYGLSWLPFISIILGTRAYARQIQGRPL